MSPELATLRHRQSPRNGRVFRRQDLCLQQCRWEIPLQFFHTGVDLCRGSDMKTAIALILSAALAGCTAAAERGLLNDGASLSRGVGTVLSGAAGALLGQQTTGTAEGAILGGVAAAGQAEAIRQKQATPYPNSPAPVQRVSTQGGVAVDDDVSKYACYYRGRSYSFGEALNFVRDRDAAFGAPRELKVYGRDWADVANSSYPSLQACDCGTNGWHCV
jgi:hypothetical protein